MGAPLFAFRIGSRQSPLARWQAEYVGKKLQAAGHIVSYRYVRTSGDSSRLPFSEIGVQGIFTKALEDALSAKEVDLAVHSAKDLPAKIAPEFKIAAFTERDLPHDVLLAAPSLKHPATQSQIGTSSVRRAAQIAHYFPKAKVTPIRGNIQTRLAALEEGRCEALMLAYVAAVRSRCTSWIVASMHPAYFVPAVGQGSLAVEVSHALPSPQQQALRQILNHKKSEIALRAERAFLATLGAGCHTPAFGLATVQKNIVHLHAGRYHMGQCLQQKRSGAITCPEELGKQVATYVLDQMQTT